MNQSPLDDLSVAYRALQAACSFNTTLCANGYGCDQLDAFNQLAEEMGVIAAEYPEMDIQGIIEFYELHN